MTVICKMDLSPFFWKLSFLKVQLDTSSRTYSKNIRSQNATIGKKIDCKVGLLRKKGINPSSWTIFCFSSSRSKTQIQNYRLFSQGLNFHLYIPEHVLAKPNTIGFHRKKLFFLWTLKKWTYLLAYDCSNKICQKKT